MPTQELIEYFEGSCKQSTKLESRAIPVGVDSSPSIESKLDKTFIFFCFISSITAGGGTDNFPCSV